MKVTASAWDRILTIHFCSLVNVLTMYSGFLNPPKITCSVISGFRRVIKRIFALPTWLSRNVGNYVSTQRDIPEERRSQRMRKSIRFRLRVRNALHRVLFVFRRCENCQIHVQCLLVWSRFPRGCSYTQLGFLRIFVGRFISRRAQQLRLTNSGHRYHRTKDTFDRMWSYVAAV